MKRQLRKWLKGASVVRAVITVVTLICFSLVTHAATDDPKSRAESSAGKVMGRAGSEDLMNKNLYEPMLSGTNMTTFDKQTSFQAQVLCPSSQKFVEVFIQPGTTGDITYTVISQDIDLNGTPEYTVELKTPISGVCANGFISCTPGTWLNCKYYLWQADQVGKIGAVDGSLLNLSGCYCINSSCGSNLVWSNLGTILNDLGGGVVGALNQVLPQTAVSKSKLTVHINGTSIIFYGQGTTGCDTQQSGSSGVINPQKYFGNAASLESDASNLAVTQATDQSTAYGLLMSSPVTTGQIASMGKCLISRGGSIDRTTRSISGNGSYSGFCTDHFVLFKARLLTDANGNKHVKLVVVDTDPSATNYHHNCGSANMSDLPLFENWHTLGDVDIPDTMDVTNIYFCLTVINAPGCSGSGMAICTQNPNQDAQSSIVCPTTGAQYVSFTYTYSIEGTDESFSNQIYNNCTKYENDSNCTLWDETVDGVQTIDNGNPTGLTPQPICKIISGATKSQTICDWWVKDRVYKCNVGPAKYDFSEAQQRTTTVRTTTQDLNLQMQYQDMRFTDTGVVTGTYTYKLPQRGQYKDCEQACKVKHPKQNTQVSLSGTAANYQANTVSYDMLYKTCTVDVSSGSLTCPLSPNEEIVTDCSCINDFPMAATMVQFLRLAGEDLICSDGNAKPIQ